MTSTEPTPKELAEIAELEAKAKLHLAEALNFDMDNQLKEAELRRISAEAVAQEHQAFVAGIVRAERERVEELAVNQDYFKYKYLFNDPVKESSVAPLLNTMGAWDRRDPESAWTITMNSPGGSVTDGMHLFDEIACYSQRGGGGHHITIKIRGYAASMGGILVQAADRRLIGPEAYMLIHEVSAGTGGKVGDIKDDLKWYEKVCDRIADIFVSRSCEMLGDGAISKEKFQESWQRSDWWLASDEVLQYGFADAIG